MEVRRWTVWRRTGPPLKTCSSAFRKSGSRWTAPLLQMARYGPPSGWRPASIWRSDLPSGTWGKTSRELPHGPWSSITDAGGQSQHTAMLGLDAKSDRVQMGLAYASATGSGSAVASCASSDKHRKTYATP